MDGSLARSEPASPRNEPTPTASGILLRSADFATLTEALDYAATGRTGANFYNGRGELTGTLPYSELRTRARDLARRLARFPRGSRVALVAHTHVDFHVMFYLALFDELRLTQPEGYCAFLDGGAWQIASASPELFFEWTPEDRRLVTRPMKGTAPRHADPHADDAAARALTGSEKERAENLMIVDLLRNDLARVAETGTVAVSSLFDVAPLPTAWQMTSTVDCTVAKDRGLVDIFRALFPSGSVTGAPKVAAMREIARIEESPRGIYCGAIGLIRPGGAASFSVAIRTVALDRVQGTAEFGIGSGITADASAEGEYAEWLVKRRFLLRASAGFDLLETLRLEDSNYWLLSRHLERLATGAEHFGFPLDRGRVVSKGPFEGREAVLKIKKAGSKWRLSTFTLDHDRPRLLYGGETITRRGKVVGAVSSGGYGHTVGKTIALGYLPASEADHSDGFATEVFSETIPATRIKKALYDPERRRIFL